LSSAIVIVTSGAASYTRGGDAEDVDEDATKQEVVAARSETEVVTRREKIIVEIEIY
jgi:hypothetical protein